MMEQMLHLYTHQTHMDTELIPLFCPAQVLWWAEQTWLNVHLPLQASRQTWIISVSHEKKLFLWSSFKWHQSCDDWEAPGRRSFMEKFLSWRTLRLLTWRDQQGGGGVMVWGWCSSSLNIDAGKQSKPENKNPFKGSGMILFWRTSPVGL